jgi:hypothetical protein
LPNPSGVPFDERERNQGIQNLDNACKIVARQNHPSTVERRELFRQVRHGGILQIISYGFSLATWMFRPIRSKIIPIKH